MAMRRKLQAALLRAKNPIARKRVAIAVVLMVMAIGSIAMMRPARAAVVQTGFSSADNGGATASITINQPSGAITGHVMIAIVGVRGGTSVTGVTSSGWTQINTQTSTTVLRSVAFYKVVASGDPSSYTFSFAPATAQKATAVIASYKGVDVANPVGVNAVQANTSSATMTAPSVTTLVPNVMLVAGYSNVGVSTFTVGSGMNMRGYISGTGSGNTSTKSTTGLQDVLQPSVGASGTKVMTSSTAAISIGHLISLRPAPVMSQASYRFFANTDSTTPGTPLGAVNTGGVIGAGTSFRLRINLGNASGGTDASNVSQRQYKLQYSPAGADDNCDTGFAFESYQDVGASTPISYYDNPTPADATPYVASANDPTRSGVTAVSQRYHEASILSLASSIPSGQDGLWDIALKFADEPASTIYCLRVVESLATGSVQVLNQYDNIPRVEIASASFAQAGYRWFANSDSTVPGAAIASQDTSATVAPETPYRLRQSVGVDLANVAANGASFKLQYAERVGVCDTSFTGETYADVYSNTVLSQSLEAGNVVEDTSIGTKAWTNPQNATLSDLSFATASAKSISGENTTYLKTSSYGFTVPTSATIRGVKLVGDVSASRPAMPGFGTVSSGSVRLVKSGVIVGDDRGTDNSYWQSGIGWGGSNKLWGVNLTPADVNSGSFGSVLSSLISGDDINSSTARVDALSMNVYYTLPTANPFEYFDNPNALENSSISPATGDPVNGSRPIVYQTYRESDPFPVANAIASGSDGLWDFVIVPRTAAIGKSYCFRVVKASGALLDSYSKIAEISVAAAGPTLDQQLRGGQSYQNGTKTPLVW